MKVIDAHTGKEVTVGDVIPLPGYSGRAYIHDDGRTEELPGTGDCYQVLAIEPGLLSAHMVAIVKSDGQIEKRRIPLQVRWTHPAFLLQHVAFVPS